MKKISLNTILLTVILLLSLLNGCNSCSKGERVTQEALKTIKKKVDSLDATVKTANAVLYNNLSKDIEMILIVENEIDGKNKRSIEIKEIVKNYK